MSDDPISAWKRDAGSPSQGAQAASSFVLGPTHERGFMKKLVQKGYSRRLRFAREVVALRTLQELGDARVPRLLADNADRVDGKEGA